MKKFKIVVNGKAYEVEVEELDSSSTAAASKPAAPSAETVKPVSAVSSSGGEVITAPLPGTVWKLKTSAGAKVSAGDVVIILEAMKMENEILAPIDGVVSEVRVTEGVSVDTGQVLMVIS